MQGKSRARRVEDLLAGAGLVQVINYSFTDQKWPDVLRLDEEDERRKGVSITNPLSADQSVMRTLLLPGLLATAQRNVSVRQERVPIFERGRVYLPGYEELPQEPERVGLLVAGPWQEQSWLARECAEGYFLVKGLVERLAAGLHVSLRFSRSQEPFLHPGKSAEIHDEDDHVLGWVGELHPLVAQAYDLKGVVGVAELDMDRFLDAMPQVVAFRDLLAYPCVEQDVALLVDESLPADSLLESVRRAAGELLEDVWVFDLYEGEQVEAGKKSIAIRLSFRSPERTLSEDEVNQIRGTDAQEGCDRHGG